MNDETLPQLVAILWGSWREYAEGMQLAYDAARAELAEAKAELAYFKEGAEHDFHRARTALAKVKVELAEQRERIAAAIEAELPSEDERGFATFTLWLDNGWTREQANQLFNEIAEVGHDPKWEQGVSLSGSFSQTHDPYDAGIERAARIVREWKADR